MKMFNANYNFDEPPERAESTNSLLKILPAGFFGIALMKATRLIFLYGATCKNQTLAVSCSSRYSIPYRQYPIFLC